MWSVTGCSAIVDSFNEQRTEQASGRESTLEANIVRDSLGAPITTIQLNSKTVLFRNFA